MKTLVLMFFAAHNLAQIIHFFLDCNTTLIGAIVLLIFINIT